MKLPKEDFKIKIAPYTFEVKHVKEIRKKDGKLANARLSHRKQTISLTKDLTEQAAMKSFLHEGLHSLLFLSGLKRTLKSAGVDEEDFVSRLSYHLLGLIVDNPHIFEKKTNGSNQHKKRS